MKPRWLAIAAILALPGCAFFTVPVYEDREAEQAECLRSAWCRAVINDRPAWTERYVSDRTDCIAHATEIAAQARNDELHVAFAVGDLGDTRHVVAIVTGKDGKQYAFDNGKIASYPFPPAELTHWMRRIGWHSEIPNT